MIGRSELESARRAVAEVIRPTPTASSAAFTKLIGRPLLFKPEQLQRTGSFKIRGAYNLVARIAGLVAFEEPFSVDNFDAARPNSAREVVAASAGNHAQGVALAATLCGLSSTIFMPESASLPKIAATKDYGAQIRLSPGFVDDAIESAQEYAAQTDAFYVPPFDHPLVLSGQGTVGMEILEEAPHVDTIVVPTGGGGLVAGIAAAAAHFGKGIKVIGVEAANAAGMRASLDAGKPVRLESMSTMADGIAVRSPSALTFEHVQAYVHDVVTVSEEDISRALVLLLERSKSVVEPAGAVAVAALLADKIPGNGTVVAVLSGGNVDPLVLTKLIDHGLSAEGRYLMIRVLLQDRPGSLATLARKLADMHLNVLSVDHHRAGLSLRLDEVQVQLTLETRGRSHADQIIATLSQYGFSVERLT